MHIFVTQIFVVQKKEKTLLYVFEHDAILRPLCPLLCSQVCVLVKFFYRA